MEQHQQGANPLVSPEEHIKKQVEELERSRPMIRTTPHGEVLVKRFDGVEVDMPYSVEELSELPHGFFMHEAKYTDLMHRLYEAVTQIEKMGRKMPLTRPEFLSATVMEVQITKRDVRKLIDFGLIREELVAVNRTLTTGAKRKMGQRALVYFTPQGRAFVRDRFDPHYCLPKEEKN